MANRLRARQLARTLERTGLAQGPEQTRAEHSDGGLSDCASGGGECSTLVPIDAATTPRCDVWVSHTLTYIHDTVIWQAHKTVGSETVVEVPMTADSAVRLNFA